MHAQTKSYASFRTKQHKHIRKFLELAHFNTLVTIAAVRSKAVFLLYNVSFVPDAYL